MIKIYRNGSVISYGASNRNNKPPDQKSKGLKEKKFVLTWTHYREIASSAVLLFQQRKHNLTFWTFTFREGTISYPDAVKIWSKFLDNFKKTYKCKAYIWTGELTKKNTPHFHCIADVPYADIVVINKAWCVARGDFSNSAVRLPKKKNKAGEWVTDGSVVKSLDSLVNYMCKYVAKTARDSQKDKKGMGARVWSRSRSLCDTTRKLDSYEDAHRIVTELNRNKQYKRFESQYCAIYTAQTTVKNANKFVSTLVDFT